MTQIDWGSNTSHLFLNPRALPNINIDLQKILDSFNLNKHIFIATSGSTAENARDFKLVALSKNAILNSAKAVNQHLNIKSNDIILNPLPIFHIGGLATYARSFLSGAKHVDISDYVQKWHVENFVSLLTEKNITITSLVPTQIYDIVAKKMECPKNLRAVIVGGGSLSFHIYQEARKLRWPILLSYGMSEVASQIATTELNYIWNIEDEFPKLKVLNHLNVNYDSDNCITISGNSLLTGYIKFDNKQYIFSDPKVEILLNGEKLNCMVSSDIGILEKQYLQVIGRNDEVIKISGENVSLQRLDHIFNEIIVKNNSSLESVIIYEKDERLQNRVSIVIANNVVSIKGISKIISEFNQSVFPFERIKNFYIVKEIPKTDLGKLKRKQLMLSLQDSISYPIEKEFL